MKKVILIDEDWHGMIGIAANYQDAIWFLIDNNWLAEYTEIYQDGEWCSIDKIFGKDWKDYVLSNLTLEEFNDIFDGVLHLNEEEIFEKNS